MPKIKNSICQGCDKFYVVQKGAGGKFCSNACQQKFNWKTNTIPRIERGECEKPRILRKYLAEIRGYTCECCNIYQWREKEILLEVDHIDGNSSNNFPNNLRLLCPNCHSQTPTYKNKNKGNGRHYRRKRYKEGKSY